MTHIKTSKMNLLAVGVPENWKANVNTTYTLCKKAYWAEIVDIKSDLLYLSTSTDITEQQAAEIVERKSNGYALYDEAGNTCEYWVLSAKTSLKSLLTANGVTGRVALIQILLAN